MRKIILSLMILATPAFAQEAKPPSFEDLQAQYLVETGQLRQELGKAMAQLVQLRKENVELRAKAEKPSEAKK